jgi:hypothetical protein
MNTFYPIIYLGPYQWNYRRIQLFVNKYHWLLLGGFTWGGVIAIMIINYITYGEVII